MCVCFFFISVTSSKKADNSQIIKFTECNFKLEVQAEHIHRTRVFTRVRIILLSSHDTQDFQFSRRTSIASSSLPHISLQILESWLIRLLKLCTVRKISKKRHDDIEVCLKIVLDFASYRKDIIFLLVFSSFSEQNVNALKYILDVARIWRLVYEIHLAKCICKSHNARQSSAVTVCAYTTHVLYDDVLVATRINFIIRRTLRHVILDDVSYYTHVHNIVCILYVFIKNN